MLVTKSNAKEVNWIKALQSGKSGAGKTTGFKTLPVATTVIATADRSLGPLRNMGFDAVKLEKWGDVRSLILSFRRAEKTPNGLMVSVGGSPAIPAAETTPAVEAVPPTRLEHPKRVLALDSLHSVAELCKAEILGIDRKALIMRRTDNATDAPDKAYEDLMSMEDWNLFQTRMLSMVSALTQLDCHVIVTCLEGFRENKKTGGMFYVPDVGGQTSFKLAPFFDLVIRIEDKAGSDPHKPERVWRTLGTDDVTAKDSYGVLDAFEKTDWTYIFSKILSGEATTAIGAASAPVETTAATAAKGGKK